MDFLMKHLINILKNVKYKSKKRKERENINNF